MLIKVLIIASLARLYVATESIFLCSGIYTLFVAVLTLAVTGGQIIPALIGGGIVFLVSTFYFWVLSKLDDASATWWLWMVVAGIALTFV